MGNTQQSLEEKLIRTLGAIFFIIVILIAFVSLQPPFDLIVAFLGVLGFVKNRSHMINPARTARIYEKTNTQPQGYPDENIAIKVDMRMRFRWFWGV